MAELSPFRALRCADRPGIFSGEVYDSDIRLTELLRSADGALKQDTAPGFLIYEQEFTFLGQKRKIKGFLSLVKIQDESVILPHEETSPSEVNRYLALLEETGCQTDPVYCMYQDEERKTMSRIRLLSAGKPRYEFSENGAIHRIWVVNDILAIAAIKEDFAPRRLLLADGQSRFEAARAHNSSGFALAFLADMEQDVAFLPSHCLINGVENWDEVKFLADCEPYFQVIPRGTVDEIPANLDALYRQGKKSFALYSGGTNWTLLILKDPGVMAEILPDQSEPFRKLDTTILHSLVLQKLLSVPARAALSVDSMEKALSAVCNGEAQCAFFLNQARLKEIREISEAGERMPPRSTVFYPAVPEGAAMYRL